MKNNIAIAAIACVLALGFASCVSKTQEAYRNCLIRFTITTQSTLEDAKKANDIMGLVNVGDKYYRLASIYLGEVFEVDSSLQRRDVYGLSQKETKLVAGYDAAYKELRVFYAWVAYYLADSYYSKDDIASNLNRVGALTALQELGISDTTVPADIKEWVDKKYEKPIELFKPRDTGAILDSLKKLQDGHSIIIKGML
jgi:hypothetical protein